MAKLPRVFQKVFASAAVNNGVFGSAQNGSKVVSSSIATIMGLAAWLQGWNSATISGQRLPTLEEFQGITYVETSQLAYLFQEGIPEWDSQTTYYQKSVVKRVGTYQLYGSIVDDNTNNAVTDATKWVPLVDLSATTPASGATAPARLATTGNITLSGTQTIDGVAAQVGDRVLVRAQTLPAENGVYTVGASTWTRAVDYNTSANILRGGTVTINEGSTLGGRIYRLSTTAAITVGTTALTYAVAANMNDPAFAGNVTVGGQIISTGAITSQADITSGNGTTSRSVIVDGANSGAAGGAAFIVKNAGTIVGMLGNASYVAGGAYNATLMLYSPNNIAFRSGSLTQWLIDTAGRLLGSGSSTPATGFTNAGDISLGSANRIYAENTPKAYAVFNYTSSVVITRSFNIASIVFTLTGRFTATFTNAFPHLPILKGSAATGGSGAVAVSPATGAGVTTSSCTLKICSGSGNDFNPDYCGVEWS